MERISLNLVTDLVPATVPELKIQAQSKKPSMRVPFPIRATPMREAIVEMIPQDRRLKIVDEFHGMNHDDFEHWGLYGTMNREHDDFQWIIASHINYAGTMFKMYSGIWFPNFRNTFSFHAADTTISGSKWLSEADAALFVNESLTKMQRDFLLEFERMKHYKSKILTRAQSNDLICTMIQQEVFSGHISAEFIELWHKKSHAYTTPRTAWSLFCEVSWLLNRLKAAIMIERTMNAHVFFDGAFGFDKKALQNVWRQETFA